MPKKAKTIEYGERAERAEVVVEEAQTAQKPKGLPTKRNLQRALRKSVDSLSLLKGVTEAFDQQEVTAMLHMARELAIEQNSWEGLLAISKFVMDYSVGKPVQRSVQTTISPELFAQRFMDDPEEA